MARVLIVDDSPTVCLALRARLSRIGHEARAARSLGEVRGLIAHFKPQIVLLDLEMPQADGVQIGTRLRGEWAPDAAILVHSGRPPSELAQAAQKLDASGILRKGCSPLALSAMIERALSMRRASNLGSTPPDPLALGS
ncbi:MAG: response regulator [Myxococcales bacterium]|nr:response regulator [Myxococcales bacterium]